MSNSFPMVHPSIFIKNPLINSIAGDEQWTVSTTEKVPVNAKTLLSTGHIFNAKFGGESPLVTLHELDADPKLDCVNRTYRLQARKNNIITVDVEPSAPEELKSFAFDFPAHYTELSLNGGVHLTIKVPYDLITDENRYMFDDLSVFKEPIPEGEQRTAHFEVLFNDHYITFTKRMVVDKPVVDYNSDDEAKEKLEKFLAHIVKLDEAKKETRERTKGCRIEMVEKAISPENLQNIEAFLKIKPFDAAREKAGAIDINDFGGDQSRYEMAVANSLAYHTRRYHHVAAKTIEYRQITKSLGSQELIYAVYKLLDEMLPYRDKHDEIREGLPWLLYTAKRAYEFLEANKNEKKKG